MEKRLKQLCATIFSTNVSYNQLKGDIYSTHDSVINRDSSTVHLQMARQVQEAQEPHKQALTNLQKDINA